MENHRDVKSFSLNTVCLKLVFCIILVCQYASTTKSQLHSCRINKPIYGYCLTENYSYQRMHHISLEKCINLCEESTDCFSVSYKRVKNICRLNNVSKVLFFGDFVQDDDCIYVENVLRPSSCFTHVCKMCDCWCEKVKADGDCEVCGSKALGMQNGDIKDSQISGSPSVKTYEPHYGRLGSRRGWMGLTPSTSMYIQVSILPGSATITQIASQGSPIFLCWVTKYTVEYTTDTNVTDWKVYRNDDGSAMIFQGNTNQGITNKIELQRPLIGVTAVRLRAYRWSSCIAMRIELFGCYN